MADNKTLTAPLAVIKINGVASGYMRQVTLNENIGRGVVRGISSLLKKEAPPISIDCTLQADFIFISFKRPELRAMLDRTQSLQHFLNTLVLGDNGVEILLTKKTKVSELDGIVTEVADDGEVVAYVKDFFIESQNLNISEGQISGSNVSGTYLTPTLI